MVLSVQINSGNDIRLVDVDEIALRFFDSFMCAISPLHEFNWFEYEDSEGDMVTVRTDAELEAMLASVDLTKPVKIFMTPKVPDSSSLLTDINDYLVIPEDLKRLSLISSGNSGTIYKTLDTRNDQVIAVKSINVGGSEEIVMEVQRETSILRKCSTSPFIVKFLLAFILDGELCLCMEFMNGGSLDRYGKLPAEVLAPTTVSIISGLDFLWHNKVMHRDVKPSNILVNSSGEVKLADFGVSKQLEHSIAMSFVGTSAYMAPERLSGAVYRISSDIWSLGLTLCELATGVFPLGGSSTDIPAVLQQIAHGRFDVSGVLKEARCASGFNEIVLNCVTLEEQRWSRYELTSSHYVTENTPVRREVVAKFVNQMAMLL